MKKLGMGIILFVLIVTGGKTKTIFASVVGIEMISESSAWEGEEQPQDTKDYLEELTDSLDLKDLDQAVEDTDLGTKTSFSELFADILAQGLQSLDIKEILELVKSYFCAEVEENRQLLMEIIFLLFVFSILSNFTGVFEKSYISEICFILVYCVLAVLLLKSVIVVSDVVRTALDNCIGFMKALVPTFCFTMIFSSSTNSSIGFYQLSFLVIYLVEWVFESFLLPVIHIYILMELLSNFFEEEKFKGFTELMKGMIGWTFKICWGVILGINVIQNLIAPAKDRLTGGTLGKVASVIPGIGNSFHSIGELLLGSGMVIKNCVGVAALLILGLICLIPMMKIFCMVVLYKITGAVAGPISDKRIYGCMEGVANGSILYAKTLGTCLLLFVVTIALTTAATSYIY